MKKQRTVTMLQFSMSVGTVFIGVGVLSFPRLAVEYVQTAAPITTMLGIAIMLLCSTALSILSSKYPESTIYEYGEQLLGKWLNRGMLVLVVAFFLELSALTAREFGEVVVTSVLQRTPLEVTTLVMLLLAAIAARNNITVFTRILTFYMPFVYFPALVVVSLTLKSAKIVNIMPMFSVFWEATPSTVIRAILIITALFQNYLIIGLMVPYMYRPNQAWKSALLGAGAAGMVYIIVMYSTLAVFGVEEMKKLLWPTLELAKTAALPLLFLERMDPIFLSVWVTAVFTAIFASMYVAVLGAAHLFSLANHRILTPLVVPVIFVLAMQPQNIVSLYHIVALVGMYGLAVSLGYPILLMGAHVVKQLRSKRRRQLKAT